MDFPMSFQFALTGLSALALFATKLDAMNTSMTRIVEQEHFHIELAPFEVVEQTIVVNDFNPWWLSMNRGILEEFEVNWFTYQSNIVRLN